MHFFDKASNWLVEAISKVAIGGLLALTLLMTWEVIMRYVFRSAHDWANELFLVMTLYIAFLMSGVVLRHGRHIHVDAVYLQFNNRVRSAADKFSMIATSLAGVVFAGFLAMHIIYLYQRGTGTTTTLGTRDWVVELSLFLGMVILAILAANSYAVSRRRRTGHSEDNPEEGGAGCHH